MERIVPGISGYQVGALVQHLSMNNIETIIFFIGPARSGTSLIGACLHHHPNCIITHERASHRNFFIEGYTEKEYSKDFIKMEIECIHGLCREHVRNIPIPLKKREISVIGDKHSEILAWDLEKKENERLLLQNSKIKLIYVERDFKSIVISKMNKFNISKKEAINSTITVRNITRNLRDRYSDRFFTLPYEEFFIEERIRINLLEFLKLSLVEDWLCDMTNIGIPVTHTLIK